MITNVLLYNYSSTFQLNILKNIMAMEWLLKKINTTNNKNNVFNIYLYLKPKKASQNLTFKGMLNKPVPVLT